MGATEATTTKATTTKATTTKLRRVKATTTKLRRVKATTTKLRKLRRRLSKLRRVLPVRRVVNPANLLTTHSLLPRRLHQPLVPTLSTNRTHLSRKRVRSLPQNPLSRKRVPKSQAQVLLQNWKMCPWSRGTDRSITLAQYRL